MAHDPIKARSDWQTPYAFEPTDFGDGAAIVATSTSQNVPLVIDQDSDDKPRSIVAWNTSFTIFAYVRLGNSTVQAVAPPASGVGQCSMVVPPLGAITLSFGTPNRPLPTHGAAVCSSGQSTTVIFHTAYGGV